MDGDLDRGDEDDEEDDRALSQEVLEEKRAQLAQACEAPAARARHGRSVSQEPAGLVGCSQNAEGRSHAPER